jgi:membrane protease subunit HflK
MRVLRYLLLALAVVAAGLYLLSGVVQVQPGERAVVRRFGRVLEEKPGPGLWVGLPWGMDQVDRVSIDEVRRVEVGYNPDQDDGVSSPAGQMLTGDHNLINVRVVLRYRVDQDQIEEFVLHRDRIDALLGRVAEGALAEWVSRRGVDEVLLQGQVQLGDWLVEKMRERLADYPLGVEVQQANVAHLFAPPQVKDAFDEVTRAQTAIRTNVNGAEQEAQRRLSDAEAKKYRTLELARADARKTKLQAQAEADAFLKRLEQYRRLKQDNPDFLQRVWLDEMSKLFAKLKANGQLDLLDHHLSADGLDFMTIQPPPKGGRNPDGRRP